MITIIITIIMIDLKTDTESEIMAAQDQAVQTKHRATETDSNCRLRHQLEQTALCQRAQCWQKNNTPSDMMECALDCTSTYVRNWG
jgi:hypothetical protein